MSPIPPPKGDVREWPPHLDLEKVDAAMQRAAGQGWRRAAQNGTPLAVFEDGQVVWKWPDDNTPS